MVLPQPSRLGEAVDKSRTTDPWPSRKGRSCCGSATITKTDRRQHIDAAVDEYLIPFKLIEACEISDMYGRASCGPQGRFRITGFQYPLV
jgi:hypothetical protein